MNETGTGKLKSKRATKRVEAGSTSIASYVVGIGSSAGGLEALRALVGGLSPDAPASYVIVQHLAPHHSSMLVQLLQRETRLAVAEVVDGGTPVPGTIHICPPNNDVTLEGGKFRLRSPGSPKGPKPSVDLFFSSLAEDYAEYAIAVVLSGTGSDGSHGVRAVKAAGGFVLAQSKESARYDGMPVAAVLSGAVDLVLPPESMAQELHLLVTGSRPQLVVAPEAPSDYQQVLERVNETCGIDFTRYKSKTIARRLEARMAATRVGSLAEYLAYVTSNPSEAEKFVRAALISVTDFFRDPKPYQGVEALAERIASSGTKTVRIWVPGCATGEEAYSLAIAFDRKLREIQANCRLQVFGTDIDEEAILSARKGIYSAASIENIDQPTLSSYFRAVGDRYQVVKRLRELVVFARHDLVKDPPFLHLDLVSCRNLLIYFDNDLQRETFEKFHRSLKPGGYLFLGKSESPSQVTGLFKEFDRPSHIYQRKASVVDPTWTMRLASSRLNSPRTEVLPKRPERELIAESMEQSLVRKFAPPSAVVNERFEILYSRNDFGRYLEIRQGEFDPNLLNLLPDDLRIAVRTLLPKVKRTGQETSANFAGSVREGGELGSQLRITVAPLSTNGEDELFLISFEEIQKTTSVSKSEDLDSSGEKILELEHELNATREHLQTVIEELETTNEELQSANEELQASNEELQASNEELETANEELQSTNEELITLNEELEGRSSEVRTALTDLNNIYASINVAIVVIDRMYRIGRFNREAAELFEFKMNSQPNILAIPKVLPIDNLQRMVEEVLAGNDGAWEQQISTPDREWKMAIRPYRSEGDEIEGAVLTFVDNTAEMRAQSSLKESEERFALLTDLTLEGVVILHDGEVIDANRSFANLCGLAGSEDVIGRKLEEFVIDNFRPEVTKKLESRHTEIFEAHMMGRSAHAYPAEISIRPLRYRQRDARVAIVRDITDRKRTEQRLTHLAQNDPLTNLVNRRVFLERLEFQLALAKRGAPHCAMLKIDLDRFKGVNDSLGHLVGDGLLVKVGELLLNCVRSSDLVGRLGGDEFGVLVTGYHVPSDAEKLAERIRKSLERPLAVEGHELHVTASIGVAVYPNDGTTAEEIFIHADTAMYRSKQEGRNTVRFFSQEMGEASKVWMDVDQGIRRAIASEEFEVYYQPQFALKTGRLCGVEALLRWNDPDRGLILPTEFIHVAEATGSVRRIGTWLARKSAEQVAKWHDQELLSVPVMLNVSVSQFEDNAFVAHLLQEIEAGGASPNMFGVEVTEEIMARNVDRSIRVCTELQDRGLLVALDGYGKGESALGRLRQLKFDQLKIDRTLVSELDRTERSQALVRAAVQVAHALGVAATAVGVETDDQLNVLTEIGCECVQGFLRSRPLSALEMTDFLKSAH